MSVFALIGTVSTEVSENSFGTPVVSTLLRFLLHCCRSNESTSWSRAHPGVRFAPKDGFALPWRCCRRWACIAGWCSADSRWRRSGSAAGWNGTPGSRSGPSGSLRFPTWWWADRRSTFQKTNLMRIDDAQTDTNFLGRLAGNSHSKLTRGFADLRDKQIEEGGVGGMRVHWGVASVQEHEVPGEKECGPQHRVRDSRSQVESSNFTIYQDRAMRLETHGEVGKRKQRKQTLIHTLWTSTPNLN